MGQVNDYMRKMICLPIKFYQFLISPLIKPCCRYYPSCSQYAVLAITHHGIGKGLWLAMLRIVRCNPWSAGGYDPLQPNKEKL